MAFPRGEEIERLTDGPRRVHLPESHAAEEVSLRRIEIRTAEMLPPRQPPAVTSCHGGVRAIRRCEGAGSPPEAREPPWKRREDEEGRRGTAHRLPLLSHEGRAPTPEFDEVPRRAA